jgi:hypothetical protein
MRGCRLHSVSRANIELLRAIACGKNDVLSYVQGAIDRGVYVDYKTVGLHSILYQYVAIELARTAAANSVYPAAAVCPCGQIATSDTCVSV